MESLINRYRNITVLVLVLLAQLVLLAIQVRNDQDVRMIRVWSVTAITPVARVLETVRSGTLGFFQSYILLRDAHQENRRIKAELDRLKVENLFLKTELATADRVKALGAFQARTPSRTLPARIIATGAGVNSKVVFLDTGSVAGVKRGMGVVTPDGIVGKVIQVYPTASEMLLVTDPDFAAGVISQKTRARGTIKGQGYSNLKVDYVANEEKVETGEWFYTSGDDRIFPKGFPAGQVRVVRQGHPFQEILVEPSGLQRGLEEVLILLEGVHQEIPEAQQAVSSPVYIAPPPPTEGAVPAAPAPSPLGTDADRLTQRYRALGEAQNHKFGEGLPGSRPPDFNMPIPATPRVGEGTSGRVGDTAPAAPQTTDKPASPPAAKPEVPAAKPPATPAPTAEGEGTAPPRRRVTPAQP